MMRKMPNGFRTTRIIWSYRNSLILAEILEDELLLAIPYIPAHESCELEYRNPEEPVGETRRENPFQVLAALKKPAADE
jgi:uncharacterized metal-binding protein YceD (DUF177 family)